MDRTEFERLVGLLLDDVIEHDDLIQLTEMAENHPQLLTELSEQLVASEMLALSEDELRDSELFVRAVRNRFNDRFLVQLREKMTAHDSRNSRPPRRTWVISALLLLLVAAAIWLRPTNKPDPTAAEIVELDGMLQWTGEGGKIHNDLQVGSRLHGGTLETLGADSWAKVAYADGSQVTLSGRSTLTLSGGQQKVLHLRQGSLSARVAPQPNEQPLLVNTPTARLEVLGTQLNVLAEAAMTKLSVNKGAVRIVRLVDNQDARVSAGQQIIASVNRKEQLRPAKQALPVNEWDSRKSGAQVEFGRPLSAAGRLPARVRAVPFLVCRPNKEPVTYYVVCLRVRGDQSSPVQLQAGTRIRVRGRTKLAHDVIFGLRTYVPNGGFAAKFECVQPADKMLFSDTFEVEFDLEQFRPRLGERSPVGLELKSFYIATRDTDVKLEVDHVELGPKP